MVTHDATLQYCNVAGDMVITTWGDARASRIVEGFPVRFPPSFRGQQNYPGLFWAASSQRTLVYESLLELDRLWLADFDSTVEAIATQPFHITGSDGATHHAHVPNILLLHTDDQVTLVDIYPAGHLNKTPVRAQYEWTRTLCQAKAWDYEVFSGADATLLRNIRAVGRRTERLDADVVNQARDVLHQGPAMLDDILAAKPTGNDDAEWRAAMAACLWSGKVTVDLRLPLDRNSMLAPAIGAAA